MQLNQPFSRPYFRRQQKGVALATVLFITVILGLLGGAILYGTQMQTVSAYNFEASTQANYIADAGLQQAINWFQYDYYPGASDPNIGKGSYSTNTSPVTYNSSPVVLGASANFPDSTVSKSFQTALDDASIGNAGNITATASLISIEYENVNGAQTPIERWQVQVTGNWAPNGTTLAQASLEGYVEEGMMFSSTNIPIANYGMFTTSQTCDSLELTGGVSTNSYNSNNGAYGSSNESSTGGDIGSYGNINVSGGDTIGGSVYVPGGAKVSSCGSPATGIIVPSWIKIAGSVINDPGCNSSGSSCTFPSLPAPTMALSANTNNYNACGGSPTNALCSYTGAPASAQYTYYGCNGGWYNCVTLAPTCPAGACASGATGYGNMQLDANQYLYLQGNSNPSTPNVYYINSLSSSGAANIVVSPAGSVEINLTGTSSGGDILNLDGGSVSNSGAPKNLQILSASSGNISIAGGASAAFVLYAPNATLKLSGGAQVYGAMTAGTIDDSGGTQVHYDQALHNSSFIQTQTGAISPFELVSWNRVVN